MASHRARWVVREEQSSGPGKAPWPSPTTTRVRLSNAEDFYRPSTRSIRMYACIAVVRYVHLARKHLGRHCRNVYLSFKHVSITEYRARSWTNAMVGAARDRGRSTDCRVYSPKGRVASVIFPLQGKGALVLGCRSTVSSGFLPNDGSRSLAGALINAG